MPKPPPSPPSSDISGVDRGRVPRTAKARKPDPDQQRKLVMLGEQDKARPPRDRDIAPKDNAQ